MKRTRDDLVLRVLFLPLLADNGVESSVDNSAAD